MTVRRLIAVWLGSNVAFVAMRVWATRHRDP